MDRFNLLLPAGLVACSALFACSGSVDPSPTPTCEDDCFIARAPVCDGNLLFEFSPPGECVNGTCVFPSTTRDCSANGGTCTNGDCVDPPDPCADVTCDSPPAAVCDGDIRVVGNDDGVCEAGECAYTTTPTDCALRNQFCQDGVCVTPVDLCAGIVCETPPANTCEEDTGVVFAAAGTCNPETGECAYEATRTDCAASSQFCNAGRCQAVNPCAGVTCDSPQTDFCDGNTAVDYAPRGTCSSGVCSYRETRSNCGTQVCDAGACRDRLPCEGVVCDEPQAAGCSGNTRLFYSDPGTCADGRCSYALMMSDCAASSQVCRAGACVAPDPCDGVSCLNNPAGGCDGDTVFRFRDGVCVGGTCQFTRVEDNCASRGLECISGACESNDPCFGVACNAPAAPYCIGATAVAETTPGTCAAEGGDAVCTYTEAIEDCALTDNFDCVEGQCVFIDPCIGVICPALDAFCEEGTNVLVSYLDVGECVDGECDYTGLEERTDCSETGRACVNGRGCVGQGALLGEGDLAITEFYAGSSGEGATLWIEIANPFSNDQPIEGLVLSVSNSTVELSYTFEEGAVVPGRGFLVVSTAALPGISAVVVDSGLSESEFLSLAFGGPIVLSLSNDSDSVATVTTSVAGAPNSTASRQLDPGADDPTTTNAWCDSVDNQGVRPVSSSAGTYNHACSRRFESTNLVLSEIMVDGVNLPFGDDRWFELFNLGVIAENLAGLDVFWGANADPFNPTGGFRIDQSVFVNGGARSLAVTTSINVGGRPPLLNSLSWPVDDGYLAIFAGPTELFKVQWGPEGIFTEEGRSNELFDEESGTPLDATGWCQTSATYGVFLEAFGTPGGAPNCLVPG
jgi:hypothetical protein